MALPILPYWDVAVDDRNGQLMLAVEVKKKLNVSTNWVTTFRQHLFDQISSPQPPYFLMVFPDKLYLWVGTEPSQGHPTYTIDADSIFRPYLERTGIAASQLSGASLELMISSWLGEIIHADQSLEMIKMMQPWIVDSGLYTALVGGRIVNEVAA